ncbi:hypothetical protein BH11PSE13_BH11PSE13_15390 [soil metagenome]
MNLTDSPMISNETLLDYYERSTCSVQWLEFNRAFAAELSDGLPADEIRKLFYRIGGRIAEALPVARCDTVDELQLAFNARWDAIGWGFGTLHEEGEYLHITHACSPLAIAFGPASGPEWSSGFFEGAYGAWFVGQGMPAGLRVHAEVPANPSSQILLRLGTFAS